MSRLGFLCFAFLFFALPALRAEKIDNRNFAIDTFSPTQNEIRLAEQRARNYWAKHAARFGSNPGLSRCRGVENFSRRSPGSLVETDKFRDNGQFLFSRA